MNSGFITEVTYTCLSNLSLASTFSDQFILFGMWGPQTCYISTSVLQILTSLKWTIILHSWACPGRTISVSLGFVLGSFIFLNLFSPHYLYDMTKFKFVGMGFYKLLLIFPVLFLAIVLWSPAITQFSNCTSSIELFIFCSLLWGKSCPIPLLITSSQIRRPSFMTTGSATAFLTLAEREPVYPCASPALS